MSKNLEDLTKAENAARDDVKALEKKLKAAEKKLEKLIMDYPRSFRCKKCKLAFEVSELGYREYEVRRTEQECQPMGEFDVWQVVERQKLACCPKCGKDFNVKVDYSEYIDSTPRYSRWEKQSELKKPYKKRLNSKIRKVDAGMVKYIKDEYDF